MVGEAIGPVCNAEDKTGGTTEGIGGDIVNAAVVDGKGAEIEAAV